MRYSAGGNIVTLAVAIGLLCFVMFAIFQATIHDGFRGPADFFIAGVFLVVALLVACVTLPTSLSRIFDRSPQFMIDEVGTQGIKWSEISNIRLRGERRNGVVSSAFLDIYLNSGQTISVDIAGLDRSPEDLFKLCESRLLESRS